MNLAIRDAQAFPDETRKELESKLRSYARLVVEKNGQRWPSTNRAPRHGRHITRCGKPTTGSYPKTSRRGLVHPVTHKTQRTGGSAATANAKQSFGRSPRCLVLVL
jgi:hypothetical protein